MERNSDPVGQATSDMARQGVILGRNSDSILPSLQGLLHNPSTSLEMQDDQSGGYNQGGGTSLQIPLLDHLLYRVRFVCLVVFGPLLLICFYQQALSWTSNGTETITTEDQVATLNATNGTATLNATNGTTVHIYAKTTDLNSNDYSLSETTMREGVGALKRMNELCQKGVVPASDSENYKEVHARVAKTVQGLHTKSVTKSTVAKTIIIKPEKVESFVGKFMKNIGSDENLVSKSKEMQRKITSALDEALDTEFMQAKDFFVDLTATAGEINNLGGFAFRMRKDEYGRVYMIYTHFVQSITLKDKWGLLLEKWNEDDVMKWIRWELYQSLVKENNSLEL